MIDYLLTHPWPWLLGIALLPVLYLLWWVILWSDDID